MDGPLAVFLISIVSDSVATLLTPSVSDSSLLYYYFAEYHFALLERRSCFFLSTNSLRLSAQHLRLSARSSREVRAAESLPQALIERPKMMIPSWLLVEKTA